MTVKRQYTLPYCNLVLEGMEATANDPYSALTVLMNAECQFPGVTDTTLTGGRDFLESLVAAVSAYGQHQLSGVPHPPAPGSPLVDLKLGEGSQHHLIVRQQASDPATDQAAALPALDIPLTTVQFYDLLEAVDQLLADSLTLPDLKAQFQAVPRRLVKPAEPIAQRSAPAVVGAVALAAAGLALFFVPLPEFEPSQIERAGSDTEALTPNAPGYPNGEGLEAWENAPTITDADTLTTLQRNLEQRLQADWAADPPPSEDLIYRVVVAESGDILGYKYENALALEAVASTPFARLTIPPVDSEAPRPAVAQFIARLTTAGQVKVDPWVSTAAAAVTSEPRPPESATTPAANPDGETPRSDGSASEVADVDPAASLPQSLEALGEKITDGDRLRTLNQGLRSQLSGRDLPRPNADLIYQVRLDAQGTVVGYEAINTDALLLAQETPLPDLVAASAAGGDQADFRVVFTAEGVLEVSPWDGWPP